MKDKRKVFAVSFLLLVVVTSFATIKIISVNASGSCVQNAWQCNGPSGTTIYTACNVGICQACPSTSLAFKTMCVGHTQTQSTSQNCGPGTVLINGGCISDAKYKALLKKNALSADEKKNLKDAPNDTPTKTDVLKLLPTNFINDIFHPTTWWQNVRTIFRNDIFNPTWWAQVPVRFTNDIFNPIWFAFKNSHFINSIFHKN